MSSIFQISFCSCCNSYHIPKPVSDRPESGCLFHNLCTFLSEWISERPCSLAMLPAQRKSRVSNIYCTCTDDGRERDIKAGLCIWHSLRRAIRQGSKSWKGGSADKIRLAALGESWVWYRKLSVILGLRKKHGGVERGKFKNMARHKDFGSGEHRYDFSHSNFSW